MYSFIIHVHIPHYIYYLTVSMSQESGRSLAAYLWLEVPCKTAVKPSVRAAVLCEDSTEVRSTPKIMCVVTGPSPVGLSTGLAQDVTSVFSLGN